MALLTLRNIQLSFGGAPVLDGVNLAIERGERVCLIGRNGEGKSTLMQVISGELPVDDGERRVGSELRIARLAQDVPTTTGGTVFDVVAEGLADMASALQDYHRLSAAVTDNADAATLAALGRAQAELDARDGWALEQRVETTISRLSLDAEARFEALSGGLKRRVLLACALVTSPDLLLLDEPTNHLDIAAVEALETFFLDWPGALLFVTHDRAFLRKLASRIVELDRGRLTDWPGDYANYLRRRAEREAAEETENALFDKRLAEEERWIRQGIKARRTRNEGRVRRLQAMREQRRERRDTQGKARLKISTAERSGKLVCEAEDICHAWRETPLIDNFSTTILRGDRIGIIGPNGIGKSTLLNILLGRLKPDAGKVTIGTRLEIAFFDQLRAQLDETRTVQDNVADGADKIDINGHTRHVISYLQDFLFAPDRARQPVASLSGGERNRLLLARLFARPINLLVLDEPTNDLDVETLELLEEKLAEFDGTLLLVSHDREFINNVVTSTLVFEGHATVNEYVGGYDDWQRQQRATTPAPTTSTAASAPSPAAPAVAKPQGRKLGYREQRELDALPDAISELEEQQLALQQQLADPATWRDAPQRAQELQRRLADIDIELQQLMLRWEELEA